MLCSTKVGRGSRNVERVGWATIDAASAEKKLLSESNSVSMPRADSCAVELDAGHDERQEHHDRDQRAAPAVATTNRQSRVRNAAMPTITP